MFKQTTDSSTSVDLTAVGRKDFRNRLWSILDDSEEEVQESQSFWKEFSTSPGPKPKKCTLVVGDLATFVRQFKRSNVHDWTASVRKLRPYFVAFVRTRRDRRCVEWVDDLLRASDMRVNVCNAAADWSTVARCLNSAVSVLRPDAILDVRFLPDGDQLLVQFGDGLTGVLNWTDLGMEAIRSTLLAESATVSEMGAAIEFTDLHGHLFEIDAISARSVFDEKVRSSLVREAEESDKDVGERLRSKRRRAGVTQTQLSKKSGLNQAVISRIEGGKVRPRIDTLRKFATGLDTTVGELLSR